MNHPSCCKATLFLLFVVGCGTNTTGLSETGSSDGGSARAASPPSAGTGAPGIDGGRPSVPPTLKAGVDPSIFLPTVLVGYHPTTEEQSTVGKGCTTDADCATSGGQVTFHCSVPYYGQAQCQGVFPPGDQVVPGTIPSCVYYECPSGYQCESELKTHSVTCLAGQGGSGGGRADGGAGGGSQGGGKNGKSGGEGSSGA